MYKVIYTGNQVTNGSLFQKVQVLKNAKERQQNATRKDIGGVNFIQLGGGGWNIFK